MKLQLLIPGKRIAIDLDDAEDRFKAIALELLCFAGSPEADGEPSPENTSRQAPAAAVNEQAPADTIEPAKPFFQIDKTAYYLECTSCGKRKSFMWAGKMRYYKCTECQEGHKLDHDTLAKIDFDCSCGEQQTYFTNVTELAFEMNCFRCGATVPIAYDDAVERFEAESAGG